MRSCQLGQWLSLAATTAIASSLLFLNRRRRSSWRRWPTAHSKWELLGHREVRRQPFRSQKCKWPWKCALAGGRSWVHAGSSITSGGRGALFATGSVALLAAGEAACAESDAAFGSGAAACAEAGAALGAAGGEVAVGAFGAGCFISGSFQRNLLYRTADTGDGGRRGYRCFR